MVDTGFKVFKLDTSNVKIWDNRPFEKTEEEKQIDLFTKRLNSMVETVKPDRTDIALVYEILLKEGIEVTETIRPQYFGEKIGYIVGENNKLIIYLEKGLKAEHVAEMAKHNPSRLVFAEDSFNNVDEIENAKVKVNEVFGFYGDKKVKFRFI